MEEIVEWLISNLFPVVFFIIVILIVKKNMKKQRGASDRHERPGNKRNVNDTGYSRDRTEDRVPKYEQPVTISSDGHTVPKDEDPTCAKYGHEHEDIPGRYIVHDEVPDGYCILNGKKIKLKEAKDY